ncbi:type A2 lantipeptide [Streptomyces sp. NPDC001780]
MSFTPQVETQEIADSELDNVSGGLVDGVVAGVVNTADGIVPVSGVVGTVTNTAGGVVGLATGTVAAL